MIYMTSFIMLTLKDSLNMAAYVTNKQPNKLKANSRYT